jgi:tRNA(Glu) U13 pseudouridine synthase TruD
LLREIFGRPQVRVGFWADALKVEDEVKGEKGSVESSELVCSRNALRVAFSLCSSSYATTFLDALLADDDLE